jgi:hypothetical protein
MVRTLTLAAFPDGSLDIADDGRLTRRDGNSSQNW